MVHILDAKGNSTFIYPSFEHLFEPTLENDLIAASAEPHAVEDREPKVGSI